MYGYWIIPLAVFAISILVISLKEKKFTISGLNLILAFISFIIILFFPILIKGLETEQINVKKIELQPLFSKEIYLSSTLSDGDVNYLYATKNKNNEYKIKKTYEYDSIIKIAKDKKPYLQIKKTQLKSKFSRWVYGNLNNGWNERSKTRTGNIYEFYIPDGKITTSSDTK